MSSMKRTTFGRAVMLAGVTGLRAAMGPAMIAGARRSSSRETLVLAALAELVVDKLPFTPSRSSLPLLMSRMFAGYWVAQQVAEQDHNRDPAIPIAGAITAAGAAVLAPAIRAALHRAFRVSDPALGTLEDALAIYLGSQAAGLSFDDLRDLATEAIDRLRSGDLLPSLNQPAELPVPVR